jgi:signal transduction histidine kinase
LDTKSKKLRFNIWLKVIAWAVAIASACGIVIAGAGVAATQIAVAEMDYIDSEWYDGEMSHFQYLVHNAFYTLSEEQIKQEADEYVASYEQQRNEEVERLVSLTGYDPYTIAYYGSSFRMAVTEEQVDDIEEPAAENVPEEDAYGASAQVIQSMENTAVSSMESDTSIVEGGSDYSVEYAKKRFDEINEKYDTLIENAEQKVRDECVARMETAKRQLDSSADILYAVIENGEIVHANVDSLDTIKNSVANEVAMFTKEDDLAFTMEGEPTIYTQAWIEGYPDSILVYTAMTDAVYAEKNQDYQQVYSQYKFYLVWLVACIIAFVAALVWLLYTAGRNMAGDGPKNLKIDFVYLDIGFILLIIAEIVFITVSVLNLGAVEGIINKGAFDTIGMTAFCAGVAGGVSALLLWLTSLLRRIKTGTAKEFTLVYVLGKSVKDAYEGTGMKARYIVGHLLYITVGILLCMFTVWCAFWASGFGAFLGIILLIIFSAATLVAIFKRAKAVNQLQKGVQQIKNGNTEYVIDKTREKEIDDIIDGINNISEGLNEAVRQEVKAERMKTELITNISHDIKTPLTSILTYVDLLKKQEMDEDARKYLKILDAKSTRLKTLTDDLFEAAKAASGDMIVLLSKIELTQFMEQAMAEMADRIDGSGLHFINGLPQEKLYVHADGKLLFRVIYNVFDNLFKYTLPDSRVYIDISEEDGRICLVVKNVSKEALNITEDELMERFVRGDSSRNTEGSGLGLAMAKDFMKLMGGEFRVEIDGDLFKAKIYMPKAQEAEENEQS